MAGEVGQLRQEIGQLEGEIGGELAKGKSAETLRQELEVKKGQLARHEEAQAVEQGQIAGLERQAGEEASAARELLAGARKRKANARNDKERGEADQDIAYAQGELAKWEQGGKREVKREIAKRTASLEAKQGKTDRWGTKNISVREAELEQREALEQKGAKLEQRKAELAAIERALGEVRSEIAKADQAVEGARSKRDGRVSAAQKERDQVAQGVTTDGVATRERYGKLRQAAQERLKEQARSVVERGLPTDVEGIKHYIEMAEILEQGTQSGVELVRLARERLNQELERGNQEVEAARGRRET